jgi:hypothetical protein
MSKGIKPWKFMSTLEALRVGKTCPYENTCACRQGDWCPEAKAKRQNLAHNYRMTYLTGCSFSYSHCCCRLLQEIDILASEYLKSAGIQKPPVPVDLINSFDCQREIDIRYLPLKRYLGCTWYIDGEWVVYINNAIPDEVKRYTAFHEGFHIICGSSNLAFRRAFDGYLEIGERLADYFAASILMPEEFIYKSWPGIKDFNRMANIFNVPGQVIKDRVSRLCIVPKQIPSIEAR